MTTPADIRIAFTRSQATAVLRALSECLDATDDQEQEAIFGSLRAANVAWRARAVLQRSVQ